MLNLNEVLKALPESMLTDENGNIVTRFVPNMFLNRYKTTSDPRIKSLSKRNWDNLEATLGEFRDWKLQVERALPEGWVLIGSLHEAAPHGATAHKAFKRLGVRASSHSCSNFMKFDGR